MSQRGYAIKGSSRCSRCAAGSMRGRLRSIPRWAAIDPNLPGAKAAKRLDRLYSPLSNESKGSDLMSSSAVDFACKNHPRFLNELKDLLRIPSVSTLPEQKRDCRRAAEGLAPKLKRTRT